MESQQSNYAKKLGLKHSEGRTELTRNSLLGAIGGWLGVVEAITPSLIFVTLISTTKDVVTSVIWAVASSLVFLAIQIVRKRPLSNAIAGAVGIAVSAWLPLRDGGHAADYFVTGFFTNAAYGAVLAISILARWPLLGLLIGFLSGRGTDWRKDKRFLRRMDLITLFWVGLFSGRLIVQVPLYFANQTEALGIARIFMGVPLYALCIWLTWLMARSAFRTAH